MIGPGQPGSGRPSALPSAVLAEIEEHLGVSVKAVHRVSGGSISESARLESDAGPLFVKYHRHPPRTPAGVGFFEAEADGLNRLSPFVPCPRVLAVLHEALVLSYHAPVERTRRSEAEAGELLARLHRVKGEAYGLDAENFMGGIAQDNRGPEQGTSFAAWFYERRLLPLAEALPPKARRAFDALPLDELLPDPAAPTLVHGDLWAGNLLHTATGAMFVDPAAAFSDPLQDLAMTRLFGGFSDAFYAAYRAVTGLQMDRELDQRLEVLNLYPLLVHLHLFGASYLAQVESLLARYTR
ncbi:MAG: fructosamine kinase family protein [Deltaproteobacteria bacterium]|nr:fructosamine kinase family protein [Deltaproteobacteria bacterium]